jgi:mono/diheme cytochrome c family protein
MRSPFAKSALLIAAGCSLSLSLIVATGCDKRSVKSGGAKKPVAQQPGTVGGATGGNGEQQNGVGGGVLTEERYGLSVEEFERGRSYVNGWNGEADDVPVDQLWLLASLPDAAVLPPVTTTPTDPAAKVTYDDRVKAVLDRACISCHSPGGQRASTPLNTYEGAKTAGLLIAEKTANGSMPPTSALPEDERQMLAAWRDGGFLQNAAATGGQIPGGTNPGGTNPGGTNPGGTNPGGTNPPGTTPGTNPNVVETADEVVFHIKKGTGSGAWNTAETPVVAKVGKKFTIVNDDTVNHQWHTYGTPCPHGSLMQPGESSTCTPSERYNGEPLYDHLSQGAFYIRAE